MKRVVNGMHVSNHRHWDVEKMLKVDHGRGAVTILHHLMFERDEMIQQWGDVENEYWFVKLRDGWGPQGIAPAPHRLIHVRMFQPDWTAIDPVAWAGHAVRMLSSVRSGGRTYNLWADPLVGVSPCNEQNIEPTHVHPHDYEGMAAWQLRFWDEVDRLLPNRKALSVFGAFAYGHDWRDNEPDSEYRHPRVKELVKRVDVMATHPYGHDDWTNGPDTLPRGRDEFYHLARDFRPAGYRNSKEPGKPYDFGGVLAQYPGKPLLITEAGTFRHNDVARSPVTINAFRNLLAYSANAGRVLGVTWFIWNSDEAHATNAIQGNPVLRDALANMEPYETDAVVPVRGAAPKPEPRPDPKPDPRPDPDPKPSPSGPMAAVEVRPGDGWFAVARRAYPGIAQAHIRAAIASLVVANPGVTVLRAGDRLWVPGYELRKVVEW